MSDVKGRAWNIALLRSMRFFALRHNLIRPAFIRMLMEVFRFRRESQDLIRSEDDETTLGEYLKKNRYSKWFVQYFIVPMGSAIWSADPIGFQDFPARYFAAFFYNHGFLQNARAAHMARGSRGIS